MQPLPPVPHGSLIGYLVLENPWYLAMVLTAVAAVAGTLGWRYRRGWLAGLAGVAVVGTVAVVVAARVVETPVEQLKARTRALVEATMPPADYPALESMLCEDVSLEVTGVPVYTTCKQVLELVGRLEQAYRLDQWAILWQEAGVEPQGVGKSLFNINTHVVMESASATWQGTANTMWLLEWAGGRDGRPWRVKKIIWVALQGQQPSATLLP